MKRFDQKGVTLTELLVVLAIITVAAAIAAPTFFSYRQTVKLNSATRGLISDLRYARQQSIVMNKDYRIAFSSPKFYQVQEETTHDWAAIKTIKSVDMDAEYSGKVARTSAVLNVYFKSNGGLDPARHAAVSGDASALSLVLTHGEIGKNKEIKVNRFGRVWVEQP